MQLDRHLTDNEVEGLTVLRHAELRAGDKPVAVLSSFRNRRHPHPRIRWQIARSLEELGLVTMSFGEMGAPQRPHPPRQYTLTPEGREVADGVCSPL